METVAKREEKARKLIKTGDKKYPRPDFRAGVGNTMLISDLLRLRQTGNQMRVVKLVFKLDIV